METGRRRRRVLEEETLLEILARLPLRSITRFKSVSKTWKSVIESAYFRRLFLSLHKNSSSSWSLMYLTQSLRPFTEFLGFHGCKTWDLPKSPGSYIFPLDEDPRFRRPLCCYIATSNGLILMKVVHSLKTYVGNPVLRQWLEIPPPPKPCLATGLVTRVDEEDGVVSSFKVVMTCCSCQDMETYEWTMYVYSSETGLWSFKRLLSSHMFHYSVSYHDSMSLNGMLYLWVRGLDTTEPGVLIAHDFYGSEADDQCRVIPLPIPFNEHVRRCLTTSRGDVIYIEILDRRLKVWRLKNNKNSKSSECWQLSREEINMTSVGFDVDCIPMAMNPFDSDIIYLWSLQHSCLVSCNLLTQEFIVHQKLKNWSSKEGCYRINRYEFDSKRYMEVNHDVTKVHTLSQFVLPRWMDLVPRPPK
ncbi:hypothetical protein AALP_AA4G060200 [Arabis alpina]|uniref:F-box domain-containing protein n=1 Tax=Arabis alpina TaxID=50452 RepID=A0A087H1F8_ARAAL|nr:hypothetical protein AALP_AA4G060200 [Arabis alpina]